MSKEKTHKFRFLDRCWGCTRNPFTFILSEEEEGGFSVECPELPGCVSQGETEEEAIENIKEAITAYMECVKKNKCRGVMKR